MVVPRNCIRCGCYANLMPENLMENITEKLDELRSVYQENENTIIGLYRKQVDAQKQVKDFKM